MSYIEEQVMYETHIDMRFIIILGIVFFGCAQKFIPKGYVRSDNKRFPFQVVIADSCFKSKGKEKIQNLEFLSSNQPVQLVDGHLIVVHHSGEFFEFEGDTLIFLDDLNIKSQQPNAGRKNKYRPRLEFLLSEKARGLISDGLKGIIILNDQINDISKEEDVFCLNWKSNLLVRPKQFVVRVRDIYLREIDRMVTTECELILDFTEYNTEPNLYLVDVFDSGDSLIRSNEIGIKTKKGLFNTPTNCNTQTALDALEYAFHLERSYYGFERAGDFYQLADELSEKEAYSLLNKMYHKRVP